MSASTEQPAETPRAAAWGQLWRPAGGVFLLVSLGALAAGAFAELLVQPGFARARSVPPAFPVLMAAQAGMVILFWPLLTARRAAAAGRGALSLPRYLALAASEYLVGVLVAGPLYLLAAWLSDATALDVVRAVLYLTGVAVAAWGMGAWVLGGATVAGTAAALASVMIALAAPAGYYLLAELTGLAVRAQWLWSAAPVTCAYSAAAARAPLWQPVPIWAWLLWPAAGAALILTRLLIPPRARERAGES